MALSITINKVAVADSFAAGTKVADIVVSGGTSPYSYSLASGGDYFQISGTEVKVINEMDISNIQSFSVTATDSTSGTALTVTSEETYPNLTAKIQSRFNSANKIYKITQDIDLGHGVLTIPSGCILDFSAGGKISNGTINLNNTLVLPLGLKIEDYISASITGKYREGQIVYDSALKKQKLWNGTAWVNMDGTALEESTALNNIEEIPASEDKTN